MAPGMNRRYLMTTRVILIMTPWLTLMLSACADSAAVPTRHRVSIDGQTFKLELALHEKAWEQGLSDRQDIEVDGGMLFVFDAPRPMSFVMRRCYFPIDLIFLDTNGYVVQMHRMNVEPNPHAPELQLTRYDSGDPTQFAIELRGGTLARLKIHVADRVDLSLDTLKRLAKTARDGPKR